MSGNEETTDAGSAGHDDDRVGHVFDQTNGLVDTDGESDGTAEGDLTSEAERGDESKLPTGALPPITTPLRQP